MSTIELFRIALGALTANKLRSILTILGTMIGVSAVIVLMSIGRSVEGFIVNRFTSLGSNVLFIVSGDIGSDAALSDEAPPLTLGDARAIADHALAPDISAVASEWAEDALLSRNGKSVWLNLRGVTPEFSEVRNWKATTGDFISTADFDQRTRVVVLGTKAVDELFEPGEYPIDQTIRINDVQFQVIGVMEQKGGAFRTDLDQTAFIPLSTAQERLFRRQTIQGDYQLTVIYAAVHNPNRIEEAQRQISELLRIRRKISYLESDDFTIVSQTDLLAVFANIAKLLTLFLGAIAAISLLVGGIGIMDIMLVSVTERTREIGLRKALGAKRRHILVQFLIEAVLLALTGGILGILVGVAGAKSLGRLYNLFSVVIDGGVISISLLVAVTSGIFFGLYPAYRASRKNIIEALRFD
jgi:putative ABC transport system permease protein